MLARTGSVGRVLEIAGAHGAGSPLAVRVDRTGAGIGEAPGSTWSLIFVDLPNTEVGSFVDAVRREVDEAEFVLVPVGVLPLHTPLEEVAGRVRDVSRLSTVELVLASLQSVGAWKGLLVFSALAGAIGAYGLIFDVSHLLVAAMLINPMGAPALVAVVGLAIGDPRMFVRGGARFAVSLAVQALAAMALGVGYGLRISTGMLRIVAERAPGGPGDAELEAEIRERVSRLVAQRMPGVVPFVEITLLPGPAAPP